MILRKSSPAPYAEDAFVDFHILSKCLNGTETITYMTIDTILPPTLTIKPEVNHIVYRSKIHYDMLSSLQANCAATETKPSQTVTPKKAVSVVNMSNMKVDRATGATTTHGAAPVPEAAVRVAAERVAAGRGDAGRGAAGRGAAGRGAAGKGAAVRVTAGRGAAGRRVAVREAAVREAAGSGAAVREAAGRGALPESPKSRSPSPDEFDPKPGVPNKQMNLSKSSGNKKSVLPPTPKSDLSDKSGIKIISTKKKTKSIPDQHNPSSESTKQSYLNNHFKLEANLIKSKNPLKFLAKKTVTTIERDQILKT